MTTAIDIPTFEKTYFVRTARHGGVVMTFHTPSRLIHWRVGSLAEKEPATLAWLDELRPGDVFHDIGANIGLFTVVAAKCRGASCVAFEPEAASFAELVANLRLNGLDRAVLPLCVALGAGDGVATLDLGIAQAGGSLHAIDKADGDGAAQRVQVVALDDAIARLGLQRPTHVKIDTDGQEAAVLAGARGCLADPRLRAVLVEVDTNRADHGEVLAILRDHGFGFNPAEAARDRRSAGPFAGIGNMLFRR